MYETFNPVALSKVVMKISYKYHRKDKNPIPVDGTYFKRVLRL
jgi:hypothetical protein